MNVKDILMLCINSSIKESSIPKELEAPLLKKGQILFEISKKHDVAHLVADALEKSDLHLDEHTWQLFLKKKEQAKLRYEMMQADINEICACLNSEGIDYIPLKGSTLRKFYPEPWMRTSCDTDILVHEKDLIKAVDLLVNTHNYKVNGKKNYHDISLYSPFGMHLELHHSIKENNEKFDKLLTQVWTFSSKRDESNCEYIQTNEFLIFHLVAHTAYHFINGGCGIRAVLDLRLLEQALEIDGEKLYSFLNLCELYAFYERIMELGEYWFGSLSEPSDVVKQMEKYILLGGVYGTEKQGAIFRRAKKSGKIKYFLSRIFIPYENLAILYPIIKKHKVLTPFCQIARWFGALFKTKKVMREIKNVNEAGKNQVGEVSDLLKKLGL